MLTLFDHIQTQASERATQDAVIFLERGERVADRLDYAALMAATERVAQGISDRGLAGRPLLIALPLGAGFVVSLLACLRSGAIAVPVPWPNNPRDTERLAAITADVRPAAVITEPGGQAGARIRAIAGEAPVLGLADLQHSLTSTHPRLQSPHAPAMVQYTSGCTRQPRGIVVTQANLLASQLMIQAAFDHRPGSTTVSWLPQHHDMGLIGTILQPLFGGGTAVLMDPLAFVQKPIRWLRAIERFGAWCSGGPAFAYDLCVRQVSPEEASALDLSSWRVAFCGAETVRASGLARFAERFAPAGFDPSAFTPCYGLAEATLMVSSERPGQGVRQVAFASPRGPRKAVSCGEPAEGCRILVRDEHGGDAAPGTIGEICIAGPHLSAGVWSGERGEVVEHADIFLRQGQRFLPTGDLGLISDGALAPVDRIKDTIIVHGRKLHAVDVEDTALSHPDPQILAAAAFAVDTGEAESLVLLCEVDWRALPHVDAGQTAGLSKRIGQVHGVAPVIGFLPYGALPRTSSGKVRRQASRQHYLDSRFISPPAATEPV